MQSKRHTGDFVRASATTMILAVLNQNPLGLHGYAIAQMIEQGSHQLFRLGQASIYPVLHTLLEEGMVEIELENPPRGPVRKVYKLTQAGKDEFSKQKIFFEEHISAAQNIISGGKLVEGK